MIKIIEGDLLSAKEDVIGHQVNCQGKMGSGVALQLKNKYPKQYHEYKKFCDQVSDKSELLGGILFIDCEGEPSKAIAHLFGQLNYGYDGKVYTDTEKLKEALTSLKNGAQKNNLSVALPYKIGSDRGGADWEEVYGIIDDIFSDYEVTLYRLPK